MIIWVKLFSREEHDTIISRTESRVESMFDSPRKQHLKEILAQLDAQIAHYEDEAKQLQALTKNRIEERYRVLEELEAMPPSHARGSNGIDYTRKEFEWTKGLKAKMMDVFGIGNFRLCQEG
ncbi:hypothetical protein C0989_004944 [Termitomyces sp. Mn162]|nr:hypothetical protein C0989_004944 [Termitomyces sp. Mn162]